MQSPATAPAGAEAPVMWYGVALGLLHALLVITRQVSAISERHRLHNKGCLFQPEHLQTSLVSRAGVTMSSASLSFTDSDCTQ